jgi:hypothetical protein
LIHLLHEVLFSFTPSLGQASDVINTNNGKSTFISLVFSLCLFVRPSVSASIHPLSYHPYVSPGVANCMLDLQEPSGNNSGKSRALMEGEIFAAHI